MTGKNNGINQGYDKITVSVTLPREIIAKIDAEAKKIYISRSAYIVTALAQKLQSEELMKALPDLTKVIKQALNNNGENDIKYEAEVTKKVNPLGEPMTDDQIKALTDKYKDKQQK